MTIKLGSTATSAAVIIPVSLTGYIFLIQKITHCGLCQDTWTEILKCSLRRQRPLWRWLQLSPSCGVMMTSSNRNIFRVTGNLWMHRSMVNFPHKDQWRGALTFTLICAWINVWVNNREGGDLRRHLAHYDVIVMFSSDRCHFDKFLCSHWQKFR